MLLLAKFPKYTHLLSILSYYQFIEEFHHRLSKSSQDPFTSQKSIIWQTGPKIETFSIGLLRLKSYNKIKIHKPVASLHINCGQTKWKKIMLGRRNRFKKSVKRCRIHFSTCTKYNTLVKGIKGLNK